MAELNEGSTQYYSAFVLNGERFTIGACLTAPQSREKFNGVEHTRVGSRGPERYSIWRSSPGIHTEHKSPSLMSRVHFRRRFSRRSIRR